MAQTDADTNLFARHQMVECFAAGWPAAHVAEQLGASRATVHKWLRRHAKAAMPPPPTACHGRCGCPNRLERKGQAHVRG